MFSAALPFIIPAAAAVGGSALSAYGQNQANTSNLKIARENNTFSAQQAATNRDFQERMSNTSWQRGTADMKAAGINPMLAFSQGGASSPSGNSAQGIATANQQNDFASSASSAVDAADLYLRSKLTNAQVDSARSQALLNKVSAGKVFVDTQGTLETNKKKKAEGSFWDVVNKGIGIGTSAVSNAWKYGKNYYRTHPH